MKWGTVLASASLWKKLGSGGEGKVPISRVAKILPLEGSCFEGEDKKNKVFIPA